MHPIFGCVEDSSQFSLVQESLSSGKYVVAFAIAWPLAGCGWYRGGESGDAFAMPLAYTFCFKQFGLERGGGHVCEYVQQ